MPTRPSPVTREAVRRDFPTRTVRFMVRGTPRARHPATTRCPEPSPAPGHGPSTQNERSFPCSHIHALPLAPKSAAYSSGAAMLTPSVKKNDWGPQGLHNRVTSSATKPTAVRDSGVCLQVLVALVEVGLRVERRLVSTGRSFGRGGSVASAHVDDALGEVSAVLLLDVLDVGVVLVHHVLRVDSSDDD